MILDKANAIIMNDRSGDKIEDEDQDGEICKCGKKFI